MKKLTKELKQFVPLISILVVGLVVFVYFSYDSVFQIATAISVAVAYVLWGVIHHYLTKDLDWSIVIEYMTIATLGLVIVFSLLLN